MTDRESCIILNMISGIGFVKYNALCGHFGSPSAALNAPAEKLAQVRGIGVQLSERLSTWRESCDLAGELSRAERGGVRIITLVDDDYPAVLRHLPDPPLVLYVKGDLPDFDRENFIGVVGSRRASHYGRLMSRRLSEEASNSGWGTVSGLAYGIDFESHDATVKSGGRTVAVLGGGLGRIHPKEHIPLAHAIVETGGAVISEFPILFPVNRNSFPRRNRIIAGLSRGVIVVEAGLVSGAMITANLANDYGRTVFAVPGAVGNPGSEGCHKLIKRGEARLAESFMDVLEELDPVAYEELSAGAAPSSEVDYALDVRESLILDYLRKNGESSFDDLGLNLGMDPGVLSGVLAGLEMKFLLIQSPGRRYAIR